MIKFMIVGTGDDGSPVCLNQRVMLDHRTPGLYETPEKASHVLSAFLKYPRTKFGVSPSVRKSLHVVPCPDSWSSHPDLAAPDAKTPPDGYFIRGTGETGTLFLSSIAQLSPEPFVWKTKDAADRILCSFQTSPGLHADLPGALIGTFAVYPYRADDPDPFANGSADGGRTMWCLAARNPDGTSVYVTSAWGLSRKKRALFSTRAEAEQFLLEFKTMSTAVCRLYPSVRQTLQVVPFPAVSGAEPAGPEEFNPDPFLMDRTLTFESGASDALHPEQPDSVLSAGPEISSFNGAEPESCHALIVLSTLLSLASLDFAVLEQELTAGLSRADLAKSDILHKIELSDELDEEKTIRILRDVLKKRRAYKDGLLLLSEFRTAGGVEALSRMAKKKDGFPDRLYRPRVLTDLFPDPDTDKEVLS